jgi:hypothetical protein
VPKVAKVYPLNPKEHKACQSFVDKHLAMGKIQPFKSPQASPFFFVPKKDGSVHPCQDYRYVNSHTIKNTYPLPLISNLIDHLHGSCIFTKMDIHWGYNNVLIWPEDRWKAVFITPFGLFEPTVMFFGLCNSPPCSRHSWTTFLATSSLKDGSSSTWTTCSATRPGRLNTRNKQRRFSNTFRTTTCT